MKRVIAGPAGHWYAIVEGELNALPISEGETTPPPHPEAEGGSLDGWYSPDDMDAEAREKITTVLKPPPDGKLLETPRGEPAYITGVGQILGRIHASDDCVGSSCVIHNPSDHSMRNFPTLWRDDRSIMERLCPHGVGHPDPDQPLDEAGFVHGCDGCCRPKDEQTKGTNASEDAALQVLNDRWGVKEWDRGADGLLHVTLDDEDTVTVQANGEWALDGS